MLGNFMSDFLDYIKIEKGLSQNSLEAYMRDINNFNDYLLNGKIDELKSINKTSVITYLVHLQRDGKSPSTISRSLASIRCMFQFLLNRNIISEDPTLNLKSPKKEKKSPQSLTIQEVKKLLNQPNILTEKGLRDKAILELIYGSGLKVSEIISLNIGDINLNLGILQIVDESVRVIPLGRFAQKYILDYLNNYRTGYIDEDPLFLNNTGSRLSRQGLWKVIRGYAASIESEVSPQILRNSFVIHKTNGS